MEDPREQLNAALKEAMRSKDNLRRDVIRMTLSAVKQVEIDSRKTLSGAEVADILQKEAKRRRESIEELANAGREDTAAEQRAELAILEAFMPTQLTLEEVKAIASEIITEVGASGPKDQGKVMGPLMERIRGMADGKIANQAVRELLSS